MTTAVNQSIRIYHTHHVYGLLLSANIIRQFKIICLRELSLTEGVGLTVHVWERKTIQICGRRDTFTLVGGALFLLVTLLYQWAKRCLSWRHFYFSGRSVVFPGDTFTSVSGALSLLETLLHQWAERCFSWWHFYISGRSVVSLVTLLHQWMERCLSGWHFGYLEPKTCKFDGSLWRNL